MNYLVKITSEDGAEITLGYEQDAKTTISKLDIFFDTVEENVLNKGDGMFVKVEIQGEAKMTPQGNNVKQMMALFNWAKSKESEELYRKLNIEIHDNSTRMRVYDFEQMFVLDYEEVYEKEKGFFKLKLGQLEKKFEKIKTYP